MLNVEIARRLEEVADLLEAQQAIPFRVQAYRRAATGIRHLSKPLVEIWREQGDEGLCAVTRTPWRYLSLSLGSAARWRSGCIASLESILSRIWRWPPTTAD